MQNNIDISFIKDITKLFNRGIEKESLRVLPNGSIARTAHDPKLGSSLTHPYITTDFCEALLEMVTPTFGEIDDLIAFLEQLQAFICKNMGEETLWAYSMPCILQEENSILRAWYGTSNVAKIKHVYDLGLKYRYGELSQAVAGIHYNFSLSDEFWSSFQKVLGIRNQSQAEFVSEAYLGLIRNFLRHLWLVPYFFGASPVAHASFFKDGLVDSLDKLDEDTFVGNYATSLRMSKIGYPNNAYLSFNSLQAFVNDLEHAMKTPHPKFSKIGVLVDGVYRQLNTNILQKESEYYNVIRPKRSVKSGEKMTDALRRQGIEYIEVRALDINPFEPIGINHEQILFIDIFLLFCLFEESPPLSSVEQQACIDKYDKVAILGQKHDLRLRHDGRERPFRQLALAILEKMTVISRVLDSYKNDTRYSSALSKQVALLENPERTLAARIISEIREEEASFVDYFMGISQVYKDVWAGYDIPVDRLKHFSEVAKGSLSEQKDLELSDNVTFEEFLGQYANSKASKIEKLL